MARKIRDSYEMKKQPKLDYEVAVLKEKQPLSYDKVENVHLGHRGRVRERFLKDGLDNFHDHNVLELLLFYSIPRGDTNPVAHNLIDRFGSLSAVFDANINDLCDVDGVGENTAVLIKLLPQVFRKYEIDRLRTENVILNSAELAAKYSSNFFKGLTEERLYLMCLDSSCKLLDFSLVSTGTVSSAPLNLRAITQKAFETNAANVILVHNHPSGVTAPSRSDIDATMKIEQSTRSLGIKLSDHIIVGIGDEYFSFRKSERWKYIFD